MYFFSRSQQHQISENDSCPFPVSFDLVKHKLACNCCIHWQYHVQQDCVQMRELECFQTSQGLCSDIPIHTSLVDLDPVLNDSGVGQVWIKAVFSQHFHVRLDVVLLLSVLLYMHFWCPKVLNIPSLLYWKIRYTPDTICGQCLYIIYIFSVAVKTF